MFGWPPKVIDFILKSVAIYTLLYNKKDNMFNRYYKKNNLIRY